MCTILRAWIYVLSAGAALASGAGEAGAGPGGAPASGGTFWIGGEGLVEADYRSFRQRYDDPYATPYFYAPPAYRYAPPPPGYGYPSPPPAYGAPFAYGWVPPPRPLSCGKYYYWDGERCVDARRWPPYVGPKWY